MSSCNCHRHRVRILHRVCTLLLGGLGVRLLYFFLIVAVLNAQSGSYVINTFAGSDPLVEGGSAASAIFSQNQGLTVDLQGNVYVSDAGNSHVRKITPDGLIRTIASTGLNHPYGLAADSAGRVYIADLGNQSIKRVNLDGTLSVVVGRGLISPRNVAIDLDGSLLISDFGKHQVLRYSLTGGLSVFAGTGSAGFSGDKGPAVSAQLNAPAGLAVDAAGSVYIADSGNNRVRKIAHGVISTAISLNSPVGLAASGGSVYVAAAGYLGTILGALGTFSGVQDVALDAAGMVHCITARQVLKIGPKGLLTVVAGSGADPGYGGDGGPAAVARLSGPDSLALDSAGYLFIADSLNHRLRRVSPLGLMETVLDSSTLNAPLGLVIDGRRNLYIADSGNHRVLRLTPGGVVTTAVDGLDAPRVLALDAAGTLFIADAHRVLRIAGTAVSTVTAQQASALAFDLDGALLIATPTGILKMTPAGVFISVSQISNARSLAVTSSGAYVTTVGNEVFLGATSIAGGRVAGFAGDAGAANAGLLDTPGGLALGSNGVIYVADTGNNRIRTLTPPPATPLAVVNAASMVAGPIVAGELVTLFGSGFPPTPDVRFAGLPAQVFYAGTSQINTVVPSGVSGTAVAVQVGDVISTNVPLALVAPGLFSAALNEDGTVNGLLSPAPRQSIMTFYATGLGTDLSSLAIAVGGYAADILYAGDAPGLVGLQQINVRLPGGFAPVGQLPVVLVIGDGRAQSTVVVF